jgi:AICAR transformylase/IMP cyclohydrolase PurH
MRELGRASIFTVERENPFVLNLERELRNRHIQTNVETLDQDPLELENRELDADLIALDIPGIYSSRRPNSSSIAKFVANNTLVHDRTFVSDGQSVGILTQNLRENKIDESVSAQLNYRALRLASGNFVDLEAITQDWARSHIQPGDLILPKLIRCNYVLKEALRYGENPHQIGGLYVLPGQSRGGIANAHQVQGIQLSYNNLADTDAAYECVSEFDSRRSAACAIVKHANPCGVAEGASLLDAYRKALACDPVSAFGGIVALNRVLDVDAARAIIKVFTEVIIAPEATPEARAIIAKKRNLRLLLVGDLPDPRTTALSFRSIAGGLLVQSRDTTVVDDLELELVTDREPTDQERADLLFAFRVAKHVKSNAIVYAKDGATVGIGAGQMSRVDSARIAARKAEDAADEAGLKEPATRGSVVASDAFFPFADGLLVAIEAGATAVIQPGGSVRDKEVIKAANERGIAMVFTGTRHFRH